jgi:hypothetical protein
MFRDAKLMEIGAGTEFSSEIRADAGLLGVTLGAN